MTDSEARLVWYALLMSNPAPLSSDWTLWADRKLLQYTSSPPPWWICVLASANSYEEALLAVSQDIGLDLPETPGLNMQELIIGFVVDRHLRGDISYEHMFKYLLKLTDICEYLDSGAWRKHLGEQANSISGVSPKDILRRLSPVASIAATKRSLLNV